MKTVSYTHLVLAEILEEYEEEDERIENIKRRVSELIPTHITKEDIFASINYNMHLEYEIGNDDDLSLIHILRHQERLSISFTIQQIQVQICAAWIITGKLRIY